MINLRSPLVPALSLALLLGACGYGWEDSPRAYPPSVADAGKDQVVQGTAVAGPNEHLVQPGDTLYAIGFKNQIDWKDLAAWNQIAGDYLIHPGEVLRLTPPETIAGIHTQPAGVSMLPPSSLPAPVAIPSGVPTPVPGPVAAPAVSVVKPLPIPAVPIPAPVTGPAPVSASNSSVRWAWPSRGKVIRGYNLAAGAKGIDIGGELGQPVSATAAGKVVYSGSALKGYGELIIVKHDDTYLSAYGYNRVRLVKEGDAVRAGQTIAELGVGPEQKPVLHFEIREHGKPVDPLKFLTAP